jgi:hypothetical protein
MGASSRRSPHTQFLRMMELPGPREEATIPRDVPMKSARSPTSEQGFLIAPGPQTRMATSTPMTQL